MAVRIAIKQEQKTLYGAMKPVRKEVVRDMRHPNQTQYWFINSHNAVQIATYGKAKSHNKRIDAGNFFLNRVQAVEYLKNKS